MTGFAFGQQPVVQQLEPSPAGLRQVVSIKGSGFGTSASTVQVWFGAARATIKTITDQLIEVEVPGNTTFAQVSVIRTDSELSSGIANFLYSFGGAQGIDNTSFAAQTDVTSEVGLNDFCMCDFDSDGKTDITAASRGASTSFDYFRNQSTPGTFDFVKTQLTIGTRSRHVACGDLDGDGRPDLVITEDGDDLFFFRNTGGTAPSFAARQAINFAGREPKRIKISDVDLDGKPDLIITDQKVNTGVPASLIILRNQSSLSAISFADALVIPIPNAVSTDALDVVDLDHDGYPDIVTSQFNTQTSNVYVLKNSSTAGTIVFQTPVVLSVSGNVVNVKIGDLDGDTQPDIAATQLLGAGFTIFRNTTENTGLQFSNGQYFATDIGPTGIDFGDLDGDGKIDIGIASLRTTDVLPRTVTIMSNRSSPGSLSFERTIYSTTYINRTLRIGDLDADGKPDIAFASVDDSQTGTASKISILRNRICQVPSVLPTGPLTICSGFPLQLKSSQGEEVTYQWFNNGTPIGGAGPAFLDVSSAGAYTVRMTGEGGACVRESTVVSVSEASATSIGLVTPSNNGPVCIGDNLVLTANAVVGATSYEWTGPGGYASGPVSPGASVTITDFTVAKSGRYELSVFIGTCLAQQTSTIVDAVAIPEFTISAGASTLFCEGTTKTLTVSPAVADVTYEWFLNDVAISGASSSSVVVDGSGNYRARVTSMANPGCQPDLTNTLSVQEVSNPTAAFSMPMESCVNQVIEFKNESQQVDPNATATYHWTFGDTSTSSLESPQHSYSTSGSKTVTLTVSYNGLCADSEQKLIAITTAPVIEITSSSDRFSLCPGEALELGVGGAAISAYQWTTNETSSAITIDEPGPIGVTVVTTTGCTLSTNRTITRFNAPDVSVTAEPGEISRGATAQLMATGLMSYEWEPMETLSDPLIANPVASPSQTTLYNVAGADANGCRGEGSVEVRIKGETIVDLLSPKNSFTPNGDGANELWIVENIENFEECQVVIFDDRGIKVFESKPYYNTWDGTIRGRQLPQGVYYFIIRCDGQEGQSRTGSITLLR